MSTLVERWAQSMMDNYGTPPLALVAGSGAVVVDDAGREYVDLVGGIAVNALGHAHPAVVAAVSKQVATLGHVSNLYVAEPPVALAELLLALAGRPGRVFFANSGAEANEAAFKLSRLTGRSHVVATRGGFHGRTMGALALTGQPAKADPFRPLPGEVTHVDYGDVAALEAAVTDATAMVILEPVQGENGVVVPPAGYLAAARRITARHGALLVLDEVQTGVGRTGHWFAHQAEGIEPDVVTLAKGLGGGLPIGACLAFGRAAELLAPGSHGTTFGGNPVSCAAALAVVSTIASEGLLDHVKRVGERLRRGIDSLGHPLIDGVRGAGLLLGVVLAAPVAKVLAEALREAGFLVNPVQPGVVRLAPPLILTAAQADDFLAALPAALDAASPAAAGSVPSAGSVAPAAGASPITATRAPGSGPGSAPDLGGKRPLEGPEPTKISTPSTGSTPSTAPTSIVPTPTAPTVAMPSTTEAGA
ncbi:acetylornithine transaminase [Micromonospora sp. LOL_025]|uniref:acetylornithine transaminase n=1 Tax=Micromonospora sp. LOL_025 TaxID=3345413 RepID=UPI003A860A43